MPELDEATRRTFDKAYRLAARMRHATWCSVHLLGSLLDDEVLGETLRRHFSYADIRDYGHGVSAMDVDDGEGPVEHVEVDAITLDAELIALRLGDTHVRPIHLLLAIIDDPGVLAWQLVDGTTDPENLRGELLDTLGVAPFPLRVDTMTADDAATTVAEFEAPLASLTALGHSGALSEWDEEFVRNTIQQIHLWRQRDEANPQIFELLIADLVRKLLDRLTDPEPLRAQLLRCGAEDPLADELSHRVAESVRSMTDLGDDDPVLDADVLVRIADSTERIADAVEGLDLGDRKDDKSLVRRAGEAAVLGAAGEAGKSAGTAALHQLKNVLTDEWPRLQIGLMLAWRAVKDRFLA